MNEVTIIFPHQLFQHHPALQKNAVVYLVEESLFFKQYNFHQQKLVLHRASMKFYESWLKKHNYTVHYIATIEPENDCRKLVKKLAAQKITAIYIADPADNWLLKRMQQACTRHHIKLHVHWTPNFMNRPEEVADFFNKKKTYFQTDFYTWQRKQKKILLEKDGKPTGGKWTFDADNREKFPKKEKAPALPVMVSNEYIKEAKKYVGKHFSGNYGDANSASLFAVTFDDAEKWLMIFCKTALKNLAPMKMLL
jgi:deoxyribodipyrimidine photolyase-related protein